MEENLLKESIWSISYVTTICPECYHEHVWHWDGDITPKVICGNCDYELHNNSKGKEESSGE